MSYMNHPTNKADVWNQLIRCKNNLLATLQTNLTQYEEPGMDRFNKDGWTNLTFRSGPIRRAHIDVVDARDTKGLWMMHLCIFPQLSNPGPIYGFDVIAGKNKVTGAFHDFSPLLQKDHPMTQWFIENTAWFTPSKKRELPDWALKIFSKGMIAAGNVQEEEELHDICRMAEENLWQYISQIGDYSNTAEENKVIEAQNYYCEHQQQNPHTPRVMQSLGLPEEDIRLFCQDNLFPKI